MDAYDATSDHTSGSRQVLERSSGRVLCMKCHSLIIDARSYTEYIVNMVQILKERANITWSTAK